jgi:hypothetical protein
VTSYRWFGEGHYKESETTGNVKQVCRGILNMRPVRDGLAEAIIRNVERVCKGILNMRPVRDCFCGGYYKECETSL